MVPAMQCIATSNKWDFATGYLIAVAVINLLLA